MAVVAGSHKKRRSRCGEAAGDATALMCCSPCTVIKLLVLTLYNLPAKMCCHCLSGNKKKLNRQTNDLLVRRPRETTAEGSGGASSGGDEAAATAAVVVEREMLERFSGMGFWVLEEWVPEGFRRLTLVVVGDDFDVFGWLIRLVRTFFIYLIIKDWYLDIV